ncbi:MAG: hypothetical protein RJB38_402 [Pseudomonadota bacterium]|jgi:16S rRNA (guanine966-N2)-methyltransferase
MLRLTGGQWGGRKLHSPKEDGPHAGKTRPTQAKLRQALFNTLQFEIEGARVLDLFAGAGTLGFEALSRGAASVVFVESARPVCQLIERNVLELGVKSQVRVISEKVEKAGPLLEASGPFDVVLVDPPYLLGVENDLLAGAWWNWSVLLAPEAKVVLEWGKTKSRQTELPDRVELPGKGQSENGGALVKIREKTYGDSMLTTYRREVSADHPTGDLPVAEKSAREEPSHDS